MPATITEPLEFAPTTAMLAAAAGELDELGASGGGAVARRVREAALQTFATTRGKLDLGGLQWSSGRTHVAALPIVTGPPGDDDADLPALAVENAGGLVHAGSTYLQPRTAGGTGRIAIRSLADAYAGARADVEAVHLRIVDPATDRFTALSTAFQNCGAFIDVPAGVVLDAPVQLIWMGRPGPPGAVFPHTVIRVGAGARVTVVERHIGGVEAFTAGIVEADLAPGSRLDYVAVQQTDESARIFVRRRARCAQGASIGWHIADLGGARVRSACGAQLAGAGAAAETNAFSFARGFAHVDVIVDADHDVSGTESRATIRRGATDRARGRFAGALRFGKTATRCVAAIRDDGLILSRSAYLDAAPLVAVPAYHVSASHATNIGSLDEEELFYVQSRGITRNLAERMMALAFFEAAIARFPSDALRDEVRTALDSRLDDVPDTFD